jgi:hypothetical protein
MRLAVPALALIALIAPVAALGCGTELHALDRAERAFTKNRYDVARPLLASLAEASERFDPADRARYCYVRGMTAYRSEEWREGRRYLGLAVAIDELDPGALDDGSRDRAVQALERMDRVVFRDGYASAARAPASAFDPDESTKAKRSRATAPSASSDDADDE